MADNTITIKLNLDASDFNNQLGAIKGELGGIGTGGSGGGGKRSGGSSGSGSKGGIGEFFGKLTRSAERTITYTTSIAKGNASSFNLLGAIKNSTQSLYALPIIVAGVLGLITLMTALLMAFKPINIVLTGIGKVLGAALMPMSIAFTQLLVPLIWIMMPFIRLMNMLMKPLRTYIMNQIMANKETLMKGGPGALKVYIEIALGALEGFFGILSFQFIQGIAQLLEVLIGYIATAFSDDDEAKVIRAKINMWFKDNVYTPIQNEMNTLTTTLTATPTPGKPLAETNPDGTPLTPAPTVEEPERNKLSKWFVEEVDKVNTEIGKIDLKKVGKDAYYNLADTGNDNSLVMRAFNTWSTINRDSKTVFDKIIENFDIFTKQLESTIPEWVKDVATGFSTIVKALAPEKKVTKTWTNPDGTIGYSYDDFVMQPGGNVIRTSPDDYIFGTKNPESLEKSNGGIVLNLTINVEGNVDDKTRKTIVDEINRVVAQQWRSIAR